MGWRLLRRRAFRQHNFGLLIPWLWGTLFFLYQATQWVKSMRYLLPIYPVFVLFGAWVLLRGQDRGIPSEAAEQPRWRVVNAVLRALPWIVLAGTVIWCAAFLQVYTRPFTRVEASRWMYNHIPTTVSLHTETGLDLHVPVQPDSTLITGGIPNLTPYTVPVTDTIVAITLNKVSAEKLSEPREFSVALTSDGAGTQILAEGVRSVDLDDMRSVSVQIPLDPLPVAAGDTLYVKLKILEGAPVVLKTSILGNEHWDDPLPVRLEGKDAFGNWYRGLSSSPNTLMNLYDNDTPAKRDLLLKWLEEVDYIVLSSNRLYASIPRLPRRYPLTTTYYRALFDGSLGFDLAAEFVAFPALGSCEFPDQEAPFDLPRARYTNRRPCSISLPPAEEAFSVYDHPRVLIFAKTQDYSRVRAEELLAPSLVENVQWMTPLEATRSQVRDNTPLLVMSEAERNIQTSNGTWSEIFNRRALHNRYPVLSVILWWLALAVLGWVAFPWLTLAFPRLRLRGYGFARIVGLLLWAYPAWLLASLKVVYHTRLLLWIIFFVWLAATALLVRSRRETLFDIVKDNWRDLLRVEIVFAILYLVWVLVRYLNPDLYHPVSGGEKPMDFAYLNAVIRSVHFPPYDPWFAGGFMNYYYFGFVLVGTLVKALGIIPAVAYNLAVPSLFAMTGVGAYTLASNLIGSTERQARRAGVWGVLFMVVLGNLGELRLILEGLAEVGNISFESFIPGYELLVSAAAGFWKVLIQGQELPFRPEWWYWNASRVVEPGPGEYVGPINEFPAFTFLYADLHAHAIALPLTQVALGVALQWGRGQIQTVKQRGRSLLAQLRTWVPKPLPTFLLAALVGGALRATNTWDYPTYLGLMSLGYLLPLLRDLSRRDKETQVESEDGDLPLRRSPFPYWRLVMPALLLLAAEILFRPFAVNYVSAYGSIQPWTGSKTPLGDYIIMHGQFLLPLALLGFARGAQLLRRMIGDEDRSVLSALVVVGLGTLLLTVVLALLDVVIAWIAVPFGALAALIVLDAESSGREQTFWLWVGTALAITLTVEIVVLKGDIGRMNTVF
ncbi:MAG: DUF2298 domain-containing protein, partial [Anaerolineae bacterium]